MLGRSGKLLRNHGKTPLKVLNQKDLCYFYFLFQENLGLLHLKELFVNVLGNYSLLSSFLGVLKLQ